MAMVFRSLVLGIAGLALAACSPTFNWREVRPENTRLSLLLPCKPDKLQKTVPLGGRPTELTMLGCETGGAIFALAVADVGDAAKVSDVLAQWQRLTLLNMKAEPVATTPHPETGSAPQATQVLALKLTGATSSDPAPVLVKARGKRADGSEVIGQAAYFAQGAQIFQVLVYADKLTPELSETYFSSLKFE
jgi:hypothetical protein